MKKLGLFLATMFCLAVITTSASAQTTYTWNQVGTAAWTTDTNWTPTRTTPATDDILLFNNGENITVTGVPTQTIGELHVSSTAVTLQPAAGLITLTIAGGAAATDFEVDGGGTLNVSGGTAATNRLTIYLGASAIGSISGQMTFSNAEHRLDAASASAITFNNGSTFTHNPGSTSGNPFTNAGTANAIVFAAGATYIFQTGANPFGLTQPASKVVFQTGSLFKQTGTGTPSFSGRTYANFELSNAAATPSVTGGNPVSIDDLVITAGTLNFGMTGVSSSIKGSINVSETLNFTPATPGTLNLNGIFAQTISGSGTITLNDADQTININNGNGVTLTRDLTFTLGTLSFSSGIITTSTNVLTLGSGATISGASPVEYVDGNLRKTYSAVGVKGFEVGTANGYSPVSVNITAGTFPADFTVSAVQGAHPSVVSPAAALQRYWTLTATGVTADLNFNYLDIDVPPPPSSENTFLIFKYDGS